MKYDYFELKRRLDNVIYKFDRKVFKDWIYWYCRRDKDLWITYRGWLGWVAYSEETQEVQWIPWEFRIEDQNSSYPPEGIWVSMKWDKSYVYDLVFSNDC